MHVSMYVCASIENYDKVPIRLLQAIQKRVSFPYEIMQPRRQVLTHYQKNITFLLESPYTCLKNSKKSKFKTIYKCNKSSNNYQLETRGGQQLGDYYHPTYLHGSNKES